ncbi:MAG TPA: LytTR family DNA-binding domain-containing protein [Bacteroidia bacterium]|nr:LytTR family DNA-binding domain-containing protein [Bacteroidia bacterium]
MITAVIIDDEPKSRDVLKTLLTRFCPEVSVVASAGSVDEAAAIIRSHSPDLLFLDIEMPGGNGLQLIEKGLAGDAEVIFVTSYAHYAIPALRLSAVDYLLKPVEVEELRLAVSRVIERRQAARTNNLEIFKENLNQSAAAQRIAIPGMQDVRFVKVSEIIRVEGDSNYSFIYLMGGEKIHSSRTLGDFEELLSSQKSFFRVHKTHLVNLEQVVRLIKTEGGYLEMSDGSQVEISRRRKTEVLQLLGLN